MKIFLLVLFVSLTLCSSVYGHGYRLRECLEKTVDLEGQLKHLKNELCECKKNATACPDGFVKHEDKCYWFAPKNVQVSWPEARTICGSINSYLAIFKTESEGKFAKDYLKENAINDVYWIAANDLQSEGTFTWATDGESIPVTYADWRHNQPDNSQEQEHCVSLRRSYGFFWNDRPCYTPISLICMRDLKMPEC